MFACELNRIRIDLSIIPKGPILIRRGCQGVDLECVRTWLGDQRTVYLPGTLLKGVMRAHAEWLLTTENIAFTPTFERREGAPNQKTPGDEAFRKTCPLGRTFGTLGMKGRVAVSDFIPGGHEEAGSSARDEQLRLANRTEQRHGVAIDRLLGSVHGGFPGDEIELAGLAFEKDRLGWRKLAIKGEKNIESLADALLAGPWSRFLIEARRRNGWAA